MAIRKWFICTKGSLLAQIWQSQHYTSKGNPKKSGQQTDKHTCSQAHYYIVLTHGSEQPILRWHTVMNCHCLWILLCNVTLLLTISICKYESDYCKHLLFGQNESDFQYSKTGSQFLIVAWCQRP